MSSLLATLDLANTPCPPLSLMDYIPLAITSEAPVSKDWNGSPMDFRMIHAGVGLCTELGEIAELFDDKGDFTVAVHEAKFIPVLEELGDVSWYHAIGLDTLSLASPGLCEAGFVEGLHSSPLAAFLAMQRASGEVLNQGKRMLAYGKPADLTLFGEKLCEVLYALMDFTTLTPLDIQVIRARNIDKLYKRYAGKFDAKLAIIRNLEAEKTALGG